MGLEFDGVNGIIKNSTSDGDVTIKGNDGGSEISLLAFDVSAEGTAVFNSTVTVGSSLLINGTTPTLTIGDAGAEDTKIVFDGNAQDFYIALDDSADDLIIGRGSTVGTSADIQLNADGDIGISVAPDNVGSGRTLHIKGHNTDGANIRLQSTGDTAGTDDMTITKNNTQGIINLIGGDTFIVKTSNAERLSIDPDGVVAITTSGNGDNLSLISTDTDAAIGPNLNLYRNAGNGADADNLATIAFAGNDDAGNATDFARITAQIEDASNGSEDVYLYIRTITGGTERQRLGFDSGSTVFNEEGVDLDFRVESNGNANCLFVDAGENRVGVGTNAPADTMHIKSTGDPSNDIRLILETNATDGNCSVDFRNSAGTYKGGILYDTDDNDFKFFTNGGNERMRIEGTGKIGINTANTGTAMLKVYIPDSQYGFETLPAVDQTYYAAIFRNSSGNDVGRIEATSSSTSFVTSSDYRLKENVSYDFDATTRLKQLKPSRFNFINTPDTTVDGFLAHEVSSIVPEAISGTKDATETYTDDDGQQQTRPVYQGIDQSKLVPLLVKTIQELEARITALEG